MELARERGAQRGVTVVTELAAGLPPALIRPDDLKLVLSNLVGNAVKYNRDGGTVTVRGAVGGDGWLRLDVADTGIGIKDKRTWRGSGTSSSARSAPRRASSRATASASPS